MAVTADTSIFPEPLEANALEAVKFVSLTVDIAPSTLELIKSSKSAPFCVTVAAVIIPTSKLEDVTGDNEVFEDGSFVSESLNVDADSS